MALAIFLLELFVAFVQAIDGSSGDVLYSLKQGPAHTSGALDAKAPPRIVLAASARRLGVARIPAAGNASITIHELASGAEVKTLSFEPSSGRACENRGGPSSRKGTFFFERRESTSGTVIDLEQATRVMLHVHQKGVGVCGIFPYEIAETKVNQVMDFARENQHPLQCTLEKA